MGLSLAAWAGGDPDGATVALRAAVAHEARTGNRPAAVAPAPPVAVMVLAGSAPTFEAAATLGGAVAGPVFGMLPVWLGPHRLVGTAS